MWRLHTLVSNGTVDCCLLRFDPRCHLLGLPRDKWGYFIMQYTKHYWLLLLELADCVFCSIVLFSVYCLSYVFFHGNKEAYGVTYTYIYSSRWGCCCWLLLCDHGLDLLNHLFVRVQSSSAYWVGSSISSPTIFQFLSIILEVKSLLHFLHVSFSRWWVYVAGGKSSFSYILLVLLNSPNFTYLRF